MEKKLKKNRRALKKTKKIKAKGLRKCRRLAGIALIFRYGSQLLQEGKLPYSDVIYPFFSNLYESEMPGRFIRLICDGIWNWEHYPTLYFMMGVPAFLLFLGLTVMINFRENSKDHEHVERTSKAWNEGGYYTYNLTPAIRKIMERIKNAFGQAEQNLWEISQDTAVLYVVYQGREYIEDLIKVQQWDVTPYGLPLVARYDSVEDIITIDVDGTEESLSREESVTMEDMEISYLN